MSGKIVGEVLDYAPDDLTDAELLVLVALAENARDTGPDARITKTSAAAIAKRVRRSPGTVQNVLVELRRRGLIAAQHKASRGHAQNYRIHQLEAHHRATTTRQETPA